MLQLRPWKVALVVFALLFGVVFTLPNLLPRSVTDSLPAWVPAPRLNLGLDLQGGSYLLLEVDTVQLKREKLNNLTEDVRRVLTQQQIGFTGLGATPTAVAVRITNPAQIDQAFKELVKLSAPTASGGRDLVVTQQPNQMLSLTAPPQADAAAINTAVEQSIEIIRKRIDQLGTREPSITRSGATRIVIEAPGESDPEKLKAVIGKTAKLTFQMVDDSVTAEEAAAGRVPPGSVLLPSDESYDRNGVVVKRRIDVSGDMLTDARPSFDQNGRPSLNFRFNGLGTRRFAQVTQNNVNKRFAIVLDERVLSAPTIINPILGGSGEITGNFTQESANQLANMLRSGALPAKLNVQEQRTVGAELGADSIRAGEVSLAIGAVAIFAFIILSYGLFGVFAAIALVVNGFLIIGLMSLTQATLTLPGIAGLILTLAVAVDANVLTYERMREEARAGRTPLLAADAGFRRAWVTIFDANVTTLIAAVIMFLAGTGTVKGFAWTLGFGVLTSVFTAVVVTQVLLGWWFRTFKPKTLPIL
jgi:preprotein translocase subunit SecD